MPRHNISILNLQHKAKIGAALTHKQVAAIKTFYDHIKQNQEPDEYGIYKEAYELISALEIDPKKLHAGHPLNPQQRIKLSALYRQIIAIYQDNETEIVIPGTDQTKITDACKEVLKALTISSPEFEVYIKTQQEEHQHLTKLNAQEQAELEQQGIHKNISLVLMLRRAIQDNKNYSLTEQQIKLIKDALGKEQFDFFLQRYNLNAKHLSMDDLRMLIIGTISNTNEQILQSSFFHHLYYALDINERDPSAQFQLGTKLSKSILDYKSQHEAIKRISKAPPTDLLDRIINFARSFIPEKWNFIISERLKVNPNFANDLDTANLAANVRRWHRKPNPSQSEKQIALEQHAASCEFLFHKIAYKNLKDGTIIPIMEANGKIQYYKAFNLINKDGLVGMALVPANTNQQHIDVKVLFRGTHSIGSAIMDAEKYGAGYHSYREHEGEILAKLNQVIGKEKQEAKKHGYNPSISLTAGGHSLGGALTQNFYASLMKCKLLPLYNKYHGDHKTLNKMLLPIVAKQVAYELKMSYLDKKYKTRKAKEDLIEERIANLLKSLDKYQGKHIHDEHLSSISDMDFNILNSAGAPCKIRDLAADSLALLQATQRPPLKLQFTNLMVGGDIVQQTGQTTVSAGLPPENIAVETMKIDSGLEGKAKKQTLIATSFAVVQFLVKTFFIGLKIPLIPWIPKFSDILQNIQKAHCDLHFDTPDKPVKYTLQSNRDNTAQKQIENLTTKIPIVNSEYFQVVKKHLSSWLKTIYSKLSLPFNMLADGESLVRKGINKIDELLGIEAATFVANLAGYTKVAAFLKQDTPPKLELDEPTKAIPSTTHLEKRPTAHVDKTLHHKHEAPHKSKLHYKYKHHDSTAQKSHGEMLGQRAQLLHRPPKPT